MTFKCRPLGVCWWPRCQVLVVQLLASLPPQQAQFPTAAGHPCRSLWIKAVRLVVAIRFNTVHIGKVYLVLAL